MDNWFTITREAVLITLDECSIRLRDVSHIDYHYIDSKLCGATMAIFPEGGVSSQVEVGRNDAESLKKLIEEFVLVVHR